MLTLVPPKIKRVLISTPSIRGGTNLSTPILRGVLISTRNSRGQEEPYRGTCIYGQTRVPLVWKSLKQKVTTVSSTSAEFIGVSDMFDLLQCAHELAEFIQARQETPFTVFQDNTSTITIAYMGRSVLVSCKAQIHRYSLFLVQRALRSQVC